MKKATLLALALLCLGSVSAWGQAVTVTASAIRLASAEPTGPCPSRGLARLYTDAIYVCPQSGTQEWAAASGGGTTINSTDGVLPYRVDSTTFGNSAFASNALNSTYLQATSGASGAGLTLGIGGGGTDENLTLTPKGAGVIRAPGGAYSYGFQGSGNALTSGVGYISGQLALTYAGTSVVGMSSSGGVHSFKMGTTGLIGFTNGLFNDNIDTGWSRQSAGILRATNGSTGPAQLLIGTSSESASAQLSVYSASTSRAGLKVQAASGTASTQINIENRDGSGVLQGGFFASGVVLTGVFTVATLPSAATVGQGSRAFVSDANATIILGLGTTVAGGGSNKVPVYSDGTNWIIG